MLARATTLLALLLAALAAERPAAAAPSSADDLVRGALGHLVFRTAGAEMTIQIEVRSDRGEVRTRSLYARTRQVDGLSRTLVKLLAPSDVAGTGFLYLEKAAGEDEQYMYLPSLKVVKRVAGDQKQSSFLGSDFTYADLEWADLDGARCELRPAEDVGEHRCQVVECRAAAGRRGAATVRVYVREKDGVPLRLQFLGAGGELRKTLFIKKVEPVGKRPMATELKMVDRLAGSTTVLRLGEVRLRGDLPAADFTVEALRPR